MYVPFDHIHLIRSIDLEMVCFRLMTTGCYGLISLYRSSNVVDRLVVNKIRDANLSPTVDWNRDLTILTQMVFVYGSG